MVGNFRRSLSFPVKTRPDPEKSYHVRSASLPCRFHPFIAQLEDEIIALRTWHSPSHPGSGSPAWIRDGLTLLHHLHSSLNVLLQHPQALDPLRRRSGLAHRLLDNFLHFADAHASFRSSIVDLKQHHSATQAAIRRRDGASLASCVRSLKISEKELIKLAAAVRTVGRSPALELADDVAEAKLAGVLREVTSATAVASAAVFAGTAAMSSVASAASSSLSSLRCSCVVGPLMWRMGTFRKRKEEEVEVGERWRRSALGRLQKVEECTGELESESDRLFRSLLQAIIMMQSFKRKITCIIYNR